MRDGFKIVDKVYYIDGHRLAIYDDFDIFDVDGRMEPAEIRLRYKYFNIVMRKGGYKKIMDNCYNEYTLSVSEEYADECFISKKVIRINRNNDTLDRRLDVVKGLIEDHNIYVEKKATKLRKLADSLEDGELEPFQIRLKVYNRVEKEE
jgi:hypothetical protein